MSEITIWGFTILIFLTIWCLALVLEIANIKDMIIDLESKLDPKLSNYDSKNGVIMNRWIPISKRLPDDGSDVLVTICTRGRKPYVMSAEYYRGFFQNEEIYECAKSKECIVKAWMIPEPYEEESEDK